MGQKVLVADNSGTMRKIIVRSLNAVGFDDVIEAKDGEDALGKFSENKIDLVLTDWNMPNKSGLEVLMGIRSQGSNVPVIMIPRSLKSGV